MPDDLTLTDFLERRCRARLAWAGRVIEGKDPASVEVRGLAALAFDEVAAVRAVLTEHAPFMYARQFCSACWYDDGGTTGPTRIEAPCETLRVLAWPYRREPGYDPAWAPKVEPVVDLPRARIS